MTTEVTEAKTRNKWKSIVADIPEAGIVVPMRVYPGIRAAIMRAGFTAKSTYESKENKTVRVYKITRNV